MKQLNKNTKQSKFAAFLKESWSVYLTVGLVLLGIGILYASLFQDSYLIVILGIIFVVSFMMLIEFIIWKKKN